MSADRAEAYTAKEKAECARREAHMREQVYARKANGNPLTAWQHRQIALMREIAQDYEKLSLEEENDMFAL